MLLRDLDMEVRSPSVQIIANNITKRLSDGLKRRISTNTVSVTSVAVDNPLNRPLQSHVYLEESGSIKVKTQHRSVSSAASDSRVIKSNYNSVVVVSLLRNAINLIKVVRFGAIRVRVEGCF